MKNFAVVDKRVVVNVIVADDDFAQMYSESPDHIGECFEYDETNPDDTKVARIGELHINGMFLSESQAVSLGLIQAPLIPPEVPSSITMRQARLILIKRGLDSAVNSAISSIPDETQRKLAQAEWEYASEVFRHNGIVEQLQPILGLTSEELDDLFIEAASIP